MHMPKDSCPEYVREDNPIERNIKIICKMINNQMNKWSTESANSNHNQVLPLELLKF